MPIADDKSVTSDEFLLGWMERHLGSSLEAVILFHHLDVDRNGHIEDTDIPWILAFFDRNSTILKTSSCQLQLTQRTKSEIKCGPIVHLEIFYRNNDFPNGNFECDLILIF